MTVLEQQVLVLNRQWQAINVIAVQAALSMMAADAATGMNFEEENFVPVRWTDWLALDIRDGDDCIGTPSRKVRVPRVIIAVKFNKVPLKRPRLTMRHLRERDGGRCAYTERLLKPEECSMEHVVPRSKGGSTEWKNVVLADKRINNLRGNRSLQEAGLTLKIQPTVPTAKPFHESMRRMPSTISGPMPSNGPHSRLSRTVGSDIFCCRIEAVRHRTARRFGQKPDQIS
jgi:5-methylcytosine-specific restriction endonuclease McrA